MKDIKKSELVAVLKQCCNNEITADNLQEWMIHNYDPDEVEIGKDEPSYTVEAMNIVMNEYEIVEVDKIAEHSCTLAIAFINSTEGEHKAAKTKFIKDGFID